MLNNRLENRHCGIRGIIECQRMLWEEDKGWTIMRQPIMDQKQTNKQKTPQTTLRHQKVCCKAKKEKEENETPSSQPRPRQEK